jgi:hypothetical protein
MKLQASQHSPSFRIAGFNHALRAADKAHAVLGTLNGVYASELLEATGGNGRQFLQRSPFHPSLDDSPVDIRRVMFCQNQRLPDIAAEFLNLKETETIWGE